MIQVKKILEHFDVDYAETGVNISKDCVGLNCPFCSDELNHCGVFLDSGYFYCWKCQTKGTLFNLIQTIKGISWDDYSNFVGQKFRDGKSKSVLDEILKKGKSTMNGDVNTNVDLKLLWPHNKPIQELKGFPKARIEHFLEERGFKIQQAIHYGCWYGLVGDYAQRIIIPIPTPRFGKTEGFIARSIETDTISKYTFQKEFKAHESIYQTGKSEKETFVIVEGVFDAWAVPNEYTGIAILGKNLSNAQINKILKIEPTFQNVIVMLDGDTNPIESIKIVNNLEPFFHKITIERLPKEEDPASIGKKALKQILATAEKRLLTVSNS